ncbi:MAG: hypothetical protein ACRYFX_21790 [Janthinobacterium lividum]
MTRLLLLAYGRPTEYARAVFAALSAWAFAPAGYGQLSAVVFTDQPAAFEPYLAGLPVAYQLLSASLLAELRGPQQFVHRVKACVIAQAGQDYPGDELLFIDSDTFFVAAPGPLLQGLAAGAAYLHQREYTLAGAVGVYAGFQQARYPRRLLALLAERSFKVGGAQVRFDPSQVTWNSGVVGLPTTLTPLLPDTLALTDALYAGCGWFVCEQLAFSLILQAAGPVEPADAYVYHYWAQAQKTLADSLLAVELTAAFAALPLPARLRRVRQLVPTWHEQLEIHKAQQDALYAFSHGEYKSGVKCAAKALLAFPFDPGFARDLLRVLRQRALHARRPRSVQRQ